MPRNQKKNATPTLVGAAIRKRRIALGYSQEGFADELGIARSYYGRIERGEKDIRISTLSSLAKGLGVPAWRVLSDGDI